MAIYPEVNTFGFPGEGFSADLGNTFTFNGTNVLLVASDDATASISLPATLLDGLNTRLTPRLVFSFFLNEGLFVRRREYLQNSNMSAIRLGSIVIASHITGGVRVSNLQDPVQTTFITNPVSGRQLPYSASRYPLPSLIHRLMAAHREPVYEATSSQAPPSFCNLESSVVPRPHFPLLSCPGPTQSCELGGAWAQEQWKVEWVMTAAMCP